MMKSILLGTAALLALSLLPSPARAAGGLIPMEDFFRNPERSGFQISPDGTRISYRASWERRMNIFVQNVGEETATRITSATERDILAYFWAGNDRILYLQDSGGDENYHLYAVDALGSEARDLTPFKEVRVSIVDRLEEIEDEVLIGMNRRDPRLFDVYRLNIASGKLTLIEENPGDIEGWMTDHEGKLRVAIRTDGVNRSLLYRDREDYPFRTLLTTDFRESVSPLFFTFDNKKLYVASNLGRNTSAIFVFNPEKAENEELIFEHPEVDVYALFRSKKRKVITGTGYTTDRFRYHFFDEERAELQKELESRLPGYVVTVTSMNKEEDRALLHAGSDRTQGTYYFYDMKTKDFRKLADLTPWLPEEKLAPMKPVQYTARDGLTIHGYLTLPAGSDGRNLPVVINPHGGPWARDTWGYDSETQFLANRGLAVLQMNFRGSTGYGRAFWEAGFKQWGRAMQDDITDGVQWLIDQEIADPERIGIYGGSYGGYAVLAGLAFTPEIYACGVDYVGVSNIFTLLETIPPYWELGRQMLYEQIGHPEKDRDLLKSVSPVFHADRIRAPLFVAQGANDPRVKKAESDQIVEALRARGVDVEYMVKDNEGHGFLNEENRFDFYRAMERFLARHLGSMAE
ncbi:dipeptidyl aminopeptidase/acylaminoacyl peptidase [Aminivibrio pyruvatiphilus]|uniref:Dipeptidyl aminopeptidase/acylaminoacyl peptidase n=1 Tax=Aminivibrio pyruvatiphilus TaxID=1005740 RepID=A0A4R8MKR9_9BACT|nr:S9 family peptidase [Aminivibrio pyruvatiphilus]TDY65012.1 dipeptidyl aminopeptidase/acylaminoacyl peptidase [Aminivibrio pyruvatiphilus]